ncbi:MAG: hypothetical protein MJ078_03025, partial [Clostridia bacterium]|nr:hypothetical protein [Clostridia bacterium]
MAVTLRTQNGETEEYRQCSSLADAFSKIRQYANWCREGKVCLTVSGVETVSEPLTMDAEKDPALKKLTLTLQGKGTISGFQPFFPQFERVNGNPYFKAPLPKDPAGKPLRAGDLCVD